MKVSSLAGAESATRNAKLQMLTQAAAKPATQTQTTGGASPLRPTAMAPPPRSSSFGGADPRAMFEALVQSFDSDGDGQLSQGEVNALNQGGLLARNFARIDSNANGTLSGDEIAARAPWGSGMLPSGEQGGGERGSDLRPRPNKAADSLNTDRDAGRSAEGRIAAPAAAVASGAGPDIVAAPLLDATEAALTGRGHDPATFMEAMVLARARVSATQGDAERADAAQHGYLPR